MAITSRTWTNGEIVTAAMMNTLRDDVLELDGRWDDQVRYFQIEIFPVGVDCTTGDGKAYFHMPADLNSAVLIEAMARHYAAGSGGTDTTIQIYNLTDAVDVLTTKLYIDSGEVDSKNAATSYAIDTGNDDVDTSDLWRIDIDTLDSSTVPQGLIVTLGFKKAFA